MLTNADQRPTTKELQMILLFFGLLSVFAGACLSWGHPRRAEFGDQKISMERLVSNADQAVQESKDCSADQDTKVTMVSSADQALSKIIDTGSRKHWSAELSIGWSAEQTNQWPATLSAKQTALQTIDTGSRTMDQERNPSRTQNEDQFGLQSRAVCKADSSADQPMGSRPSTLSVESDSFAGQPVQRIGVL